MATTDTQNILAWDKSDTTFNDLLSLFYDSTDDVMFSSFLAIKKRITDLTVDTTFKDLEPIRNVGQFNQKHNDLNIFAEVGSNRWVDYDIENKLFQLKNSQEYSSDIFNKFENFLVDNTSGLIIKMDLTSLVNQLNTHEALTTIMPYTENCDVKFMFDVKSIAPLHKNTISNDDVIEYYRAGGAKPYFYNSNQVLKTSMVFNRWLYDIFYTHKRSSQLIVDFTDGKDNVGVWFYGMKWDGSNTIALNLKKYDVLQAFMHYKQNQITNNDWTYSTTTKTTFDVRQAGYNRDTENTNQLGSMSIVTPTNYGHNPVDLVYEYLGKQGHMKTVDYDSSFDLSSITTLSTDQIQRLDFAPSKQHIEIDGTSQISIYTMRIVTTENKQISIPFSIKLILDGTNWDTSYSFVVSNVIPTANCVLFDQNELNSHWDGSAWQVQQDTFTIANALSAQAYDSTTGILSIDNTSLSVVDNTIQFKITSSDKIRKIGNEFLNGYTIVNRNLYGIDDPQNWTRFTIMRDYSTDMIQEGVAINPFGAVENSTLYGGMQMQYYTPPFGNQQIGSFSNDMRYEMNSSSVLYLYNCMNNIIRNGTSYYTTKAYKTATWTYGIYGFYNTLMNRIYFMEPMWSSPNMRHRLAAWEVGPNTNRVLNVTNFDGTYVSSPKYAKYTIDETSFEFTTIQQDTGSNRYAQGVYRNQYKFNTMASNFPTFKQIWYGWLNELYYDSRCRIGFPTYINDNTLQISDEFGNIYEAGYTITNRTGTANETLHNTKNYLKLVKGQRFIFPNPYVITTAYFWHNLRPFFRLDSTTAYGFKVHPCLMNGKTTTYQTAIYKITPNDVKFYLVNNPVPTIQLNFFPCQRLFFDSSLWFDSTYQTNYGFRRLEFNETDMTIKMDSTGASPGYRIIQPDVDYRKLWLIYSSGKTLQTYDVDDQTIDFVSDPPASCSTMNGFVKNGTDYWFLGKNSSGTRCLWKCSLDGTIMTEVETRMVVGLPDTLQGGYTDDIATEFNWLQYKDGTINAYLNQPLSSSTKLYFVVIIPTDNSNAVAHYSTTIWLNNETDTEYHKLRGNGTGIGTYSGQVGNTPVVFWQSAPFKIIGYDPDTSCVIVDKLQSEPYTDYVIHGHGIDFQPTLTNQQNQALRFGYSLYNEDKHYALVNTTSTILYAVLYKKIKDIYAFAPKMNHMWFDMSTYTIDATQTAATNGQNLDGVISWISREAGETASMGGASIIRRWIERRTYDSNTDYQKTFKSYWYDRYITNQTSAQICPFSQRSLDNSDVIEFMNYNSQIQSWNQISNIFDKVNVYRAASTIVTSSIDTISGHQQKHYIRNANYMYSLKVNRWFSLPYNKTRSTTTMGSFVSYLGGDYFAQTFNYGYNGFLWGANCDSFNLNRINWFCPSFIMWYTNKPVRQYFEDASNTMYTNLSDAVIIDHPKFYNNIYGCDINPDTFDEYKSAIHTCMDERWWLLGAGMQWFKGNYDKINIHEMQYCATATPASTDVTTIRNAKVNGEMSHNYRLLKYQRHNANVSGSSFNDGKNGINTNAYVSLLSDMTIVDFTKVDSTTLFIGGLIKMDQTWAMAWETQDFAIKDGSREKTARITTEVSDRQLLRDTQYHSVTCANQAPFSETIDFSNIVSSTVKEFNDFYIKIDVTDSTAQTGSIYVNNPKGTFAEFKDNKIQWLAHTSYFKSDVPFTDDAYAGYTFSHLNAYFVFPYNGKIVKVPFRYRHDETQQDAAGNPWLYDWTYNYTKFQDSTPVIDAFTTYSVTGDMWYSVPLLLIDNSIMWFASDVSNRLFSVNLVDGTIINEYSNIKVRYKQDLDGRLMNIKYDYIIANGYIRKLGTLEANGTLTDLGSIDILTTDILGDKTTSVTDFTVISNGNYINIFNIDTSISDIFLGDKIEYRYINWYHDSSYAIFVSLTVRNMHSHTHDEMILVLSKTDQKWDITGKRFGERIYNGADTVTLTNIMNEILVRSKDIIEIKSSPNYPLYSDLISYYDPNTRSIKYFDYYDGLIYAIEDAVVYDGAFFYRNMPQKQPTKEFAIWYKPLVCMQYHDILPNAYFFPQRCNDGTNTIGTPIDYIYDKTNLYLLVNFGSTVDKLKLTIDVAAIVDYNTELATYAIANNPINRVEEQVISFNGLIPHGVVTFERKNLFKEAISANRLIKVTTDYTFTDWSTTFPDKDFFTTDLITDNTGLSPFNTFGLQMQKFASLSVMKRLTDNFYYDFTTNSTYFNASPIPEPLWRTNPTPLYSKIKDGTATSEYIINPNLLNENALLFIFVPLTSKLGQNTNNLYSTYYKWYHSRVCGTIKFEYDPTVYSRDEAVVKYHRSSGDDFEASQNSFIYDTMDATMKSWDWITLKYTPQPDASSMYSYHTYTDYTNLTLKEPNHYWLASLRDTTAQSQLPQGINDSFTYAGNVDQTAQIDNLSFDESNTGPFYGTWTFTGDITATGLHASIMSLSGHTVAVDVTVKLYSSDNTVLRDFSATIQGTYQTEVEWIWFEDATVSYQPSIAFRKIQLIANRQAIQNTECRIFDIQFEKTTTNDSYQSNQQKKFVVLNRVGDTYYSCNIHQYKHYAADSALEMYFQQSRLADTTFTMIAARNGLENNELTLNMMAYDGTYEVLDSGSNSWQKHTFNLDSSAVGFIINVKPETTKSVPVIDVKTDSTNDQLGGTDNRFVWGKLRGKK